MANYEYRYETCTMQMLPPDLRAEVTQATQEQGGIVPTAYMITITGESERAYALHCPEINRLGISWGAAADWATVNSLDGGINMWLNGTADEWETAQ